MRTAIAGLRRIRWCAAVGLGTFCTWVATHAGAASVTFQNGVNGYQSGTHATLLRSSPTTCDTSWCMQVMGLVSNPSLTNFGTIRFDNIFGSSPGQIPANAVISSATLQLEIYTPYVVSGANTINTYPMLTSWSIPYDCYSYRGYNGGITAYWGNQNQATNGPVADIDYNASMGVTTSYASLVQGDWMSVNVTNIVAAWQNGSVPNQGFFLNANDAWGGAKFRASGADSPKLTVTYTTAPTTTTFQNGVNGYQSGTHATLLRSSPTTCDTSWLLQVLGVVSNPSLTNFGTLKFDSIFGSGSGQVPLTASISSATLQLEVYTPYVVSGANTINTYPMLTSWSIPYDCYSYRGYNGGITAYWGNQSQATNGPVANIDYNASMGVTTSYASLVQGNWMNIDVTNMVKGWQNGSLPNQGFFLSANDTWGGVKFRASGADSPKLSVTYDPNASSYVWKNVALSGAGAMVTGVVAHPLQSGLFYIRTDVGGAYRWNAANSSWIPLNDSIPIEKAYTYSCESLAVDPTNANVVYYAGGFQTTKGNGTLYKSTDQGATWTELSLAVPMGGNMDRRWGGERLAVSPFNGNYVLFGSRTQGLWRSTNAGASWTQVSTSSIPVAANTYGVQCVAFDPVTSGKVYAAVSTYGVYVSNDNGATWSSIGGNTDPMRVTVGPDGVLWYTTRTGVSKYSGGSWTNYTVGGTDIYMALAVNPTNGNDVLVEKGEWGTYTIWRTTNGGTTWTQQSTTLSSNVTWVPTPPRFRPCAFAFDPFNPSTVFGSQWHTNNINASPVSWVMTETGHEEDVTGAAIAPPSGYEFLCGVFDDDGFALMNGLDNYPSNKLGIVNSWNGHTWSMDFQESNPLNMVRLGSQSFYGGVLAVAKSADGGNNWNRMSFPGSLFPQQCAISATNGNNMVVICNAKYSSNPNDWSQAVTATDPWRYTTDGGGSWGIIAGLPTPPAPWGPWYHQIFLAADRVNGSKFYYSATNGQIYRSTDSGATFAQVNASSLLPNKPWNQLRARPGAEGDLWVCVDNDTTDYQTHNRTSDEGLYHSTDSGATWTKISSVNRAFTFGFGAPPSGSSTPALYLYGRVNGGYVDSVYRSLDLGQTWTNIQSGNNYMGDFPYMMLGSRQTFGRVFIGTGGRGFFYGQ